MIKPGQDTILQDMLSATRTIAVVGLSEDPQRPSNQVARYLQAQGYRIVPVNPNCKEILGETSYPCLAAIAQPVDMVNVFRQSAACPVIAAEAVAVGARFLWLQQGVSSEMACQVAESAGLSVVMDACIKIEHRRLFGSTDG